MITPPVSSLLDVVAGAAVRMLKHGSQMSSLERGAVLVTGAAGGIGGAIAAVLAEVGYRVASNHLPGESVTGYPVAADVADLSAVESMIDQVEDALGPISVLVNCAGIAHEVALEEVDDAAWRRMLGVHLGGTYNTCRTLAPRMRSRGDGVIVNIASEIALTGSASHAHYAAAKGAILGLTKALAKELAPTVRVNAVAPGPTDTALLSDQWRTRAYLDSLPTRRLSTPVAIARTVAFLASDDARFFTGQVISPNSGAVI